VTELAAGDRHPEDRGQHQGPHAAGDHRIEAGRGVERPNALRGAGPGGLDHREQRGQAGRGGQQTVAEPRRAELEQLDAEPADPAIGSVGEPGEVEHVVDPGRVCLARHGLDPQVITGGPAGMEAGRLQDRTDLMQRLGQVQVDLPVDDGRALVGPHQAEQHPQRGRLPGTVRAEEADHRAALDLEAQVVDREHRPEPLGQAAHLDHGHDLSLPALAARPDAWRRV
jgi:hypothetical protein